MRAPSPHCDLPEVAVEIHPAVNDADDVNAAIDRTEDYHVRPRVIFPVP
jgi:hypothetical protein